MIGTMARIGLFGAAAILLFAFSCGRDEAPPVEAEKVTPAVVRPALGWDIAPNSERWTTAALGALDTHGAALPAMVPADIETYCPGYVDATRPERKAFWVSLLSALSKHESTWRPDVSGGEGRWHGLLQISPGTARGYGCAATTASELKVGAANLSCAIRIMAVTVPRDGVIHGKDRKWRGVSADWGPMRSPGKRADMARWLKQQTYCTPLGSLRPQARPDRLLD